MSVSQQEYNKFVAVTTSDTVDLPAFTQSGFVLTDAIYVGGGAPGDIAAVMADGTAVIFKAVPVGTTLQIAVRRINATNTTATNLVALYRV